MPPFAERLDKACTADNPHACQPGFDAMKLNEEGTTLSAKLAIAKGSLPPYLSFNSSPYPEATFTGVRDSATRCSALTTDLMGKPCSNAPKGNEVPVLDVGQEIKGCNYSKDPELQSLYKKGTESLVKVEGRLPEGHSHGSGVVVGKGAPGECLALTDFHVLHGESGNDKLKGMTVLMNNGRSYPAEARNERPNDDLSMIAIKTGKDTDRVCEPITVAENDTSKAGDRLVSIGYTLWSQSPYAHPGTVLNEQPLSDALGNGMKRMVKGEDLSRLVINEQTNVWGGDSGGPVLNSNGEAAAIMDRTFMTMDLAVSTPITRAQVEDMEKRSR